MDIPGQLNAALSGRYEVEREIGAGGMATVYLARDLKHDRHVALKLLKPELGAVLGVERFLSEIKVTANLQHPNLLPLFDSGEASGFLFYVMPFVEGESLRTQLDREKQLPVDRAVHIAVAVANALDYAHRKNVIHRDLKPENILMHEGEPLVADFGIALAVSNAGGNRITQTGLSLGTPQYMSPEQATGDRAIDGRSDIYSLAAMTYEMLTGDPPHVGSTAQAIISRLLTERPRSIRASRPNVPDFVEEALDRALEKIPADRFTSARDFATALGGGGAGTSAAAPAASVRRRIVTRPTRHVGQFALWAMSSLLLALAVWRWIPSHTADVAQRGRFALTFPDSLRIREDLPGQNIAISPDGSLIVFVGGSGQGELFARPLNQLDAHPIKGTEQGHSPRFSPDGKWLAFITHNVLMKIPVTGGVASMIADSVERASWSDNGEIIFERGIFGGGSGGLWRVSASGGTTRQLTVMDKAQHESAHTWPFVLPGGKAALFTIEHGSVNSSELAAVRMSDGKVIALMTDSASIRGVNPRYVSTGYVLYGRLDRSLAAIAFDPEHLRFVGPPVTVLDGIVVKGGGATEVAVSNNGTLVFTEGDTRREAVLVDKKGVAHALVPSLERFESPAVSPSGDRVAFSITEQVSSRSDIWIYDMAARTLNRLTRDGYNTRPVWTADGKRVAWTFDVGNGSMQGIRWQPSDGSGRAESLFQPGRDVWTATFSPDGRHLAAVVGDNGNHGDIHVAALDSTAHDRPVVATSRDDITPRFSPDGRWLAYASAESGQFEIYVTPAFGTGDRFQVSTAGGLQPIWAPDGRSLYYRTSGWIMAATLAPSASFSVVRRDTLFVDAYVTEPYSHTWDISRDGNTFLMLRGAEKQQRAIVVLGWFEELRERVASATKK